MQTGNLSSKNSAQLSLATALALVAGFIFGLVAHSVGSSWLLKFAQSLEPVGTAFVNLLKMVIVPLVASSLFIGVAQVGDLRRLGRMGAFTLAFLVLTTVVAVILGMSMTSLMIAVAAPQIAMEGGSAAAVVPDLPGSVEFLLGLIPSNPFQAAVDGALLPLMVFTLLFAAAAGTLPSVQKNQLLGLGESVTAVLIKLVHWILWLAPLGVFALAAPVAARVGWMMVLNFVVFVVSVLLGLLLFISLVYVPAAVMVGRIEARRFVQACLKPQVIACATVSSIATIPAMLEATEELKIPTSTASFVIPFSAAINRAGSALFQGSALVFLAFLYEIPISTGGYVAAVLATMMVSFTVAGVPSASIMTMAPALGTVGVPLDGLGILLGIDRVPDMARTATNVTGHITTAIITDRVVAGDQRHAGNEKAHPEG
ncbi:MAG: dicarboxylate/amino acid:cation symporter [bacterium]|nr:dicarboxylate/amino acid:cation symporter [bacterium]